MPTPMEVYVEIAKRCGVDTSDEEAVEKFFEYELAKKSLSFRKAVFEILMQGESDSLENLSWSKLSQGEVL